MTPIILALAYWCFVGTYCFCLQSMDRCISVHPPIPLSSCDCLLNNSLYLSFITPSVNTILVDNAYFRWPRTVWYNRFRPLHLHDGATVWAKALGSRHMAVKRWIWNMTSRCGFNYSLSRESSVPYRSKCQHLCGYNLNPYPTAFPYGNGMVLHFYQQQESSTTKTVHKVINKGLKAYV